MTLLVILTVPYLCTDQIARESGVPMVDPDQKWVDFFSAEDVDDDEDSRTESCAYEQTNGNSSGREAELGLIQCPAGYRRQMSVITDPNVLQDFLTTPR